MKKLIILFCLFIGLAVGAKAQYVTIPDTNFVHWLHNTNPSCMNGNQMDTTCVGIINTTTFGVDFMSVSDLTGIQYFTHLQVLSCTYNQLTWLPALPNSLRYLDCSNNQLITLPTLPDSLYEFHCDNNHLASLPALPNLLYTLVCGNNQLTSIPTLPYSFGIIECNNNLLTILPVLPNFLLTLICSNNQLTSLPTLPNSLWWFDCRNNQLSNLPALPYSLYSLHCDNNNISCFPTFPSSLNDTNSFSIIGNPFTCLPNYLSVMDSVTLAYPLCVAGDSVNNPNGCVGAEGILGNTFKDLDSNCIMGAGEQNFNNIPVKLYDSINNLIAQTYTFSNGIYNFTEPAGTYIVSIDTASMPFAMQCAHPGVDSTVTLSAGHLLATNVNFALGCKPGFDVGVQSVFRQGHIVVPGHHHILRVIAGDMSQWYSFHCAAGVSGQVQIIVTGPVTYTGVAAGLLTPTISGNVFTYPIADFGAVNNAQDFGLTFNVNTTAHAGDTICVYVTVTPVVGDNDTTNNTYQFCYPVVNSYDPNVKEVYPVNVPPGYHDWLTYTIHFQNTGNAPAVNIRLADTLDNNLDLSTFQVINYSHYNRVSLTGNVLNFFFPNIQLPDSTTNEPASKGFVQYRIKPKANMPLGAQVKNTAYIFFDFNAPVITNTTVNTVTTSINDVSASLNTIYVYPNPFTAQTTLTIPKTLQHPNTQILFLYDLTGRVVKQCRVNTSPYIIYRDGLAPGMYFFSVKEGEKTVGTGKVAMED